MRVECCNLCVGQDRAPHFHGRGGEGMGEEGRGGEGGRGGREGGNDAGYTNMYVHSLSPRHVERNYVSRRSIVSRRTRVRNYVRRDVDILRHTNKLPELVFKLVLSIPV